MPYKAQSPRFLITLDAADLLIFLDTFITGMYIFTRFHGPVV
jgi:hypothetical protein